VVRIIDVETIVLRLPEVKLIGDGTQDVTIVKVHTDEGIIGIGEGHTSPTVIAEIINAPSSHVASRGLRELLIGEDPLQIGRLWQKMINGSAVYGRRGVAMHAISAIDLALWDILGKATGLPISTLLGGCYRDELDVYASILMPATPDEAAAEATRLVDLGFSAIKFGWGGLGTSVTSDIEFVDAVRSAIGSRIDIMIDIGVPLPISYTRQLVKALEPYDIYFLEEALAADDYAGYARLSSASNIPLATGEKETSISGFSQLIEQGQVDVIQPDLARAGGITEVNRIAMLAHHRGVQLIPHCWSTDILVSASLQFIAAQPNPVYFEYCLQESPLRSAVTKCPIEVIAGKIKVPDKPGLGVELNSETIEEFRYQPSQTEA
jgi:L-rhamnonate dehydratase